MPPKSLMQAAIDYANKGYFIFPLKPKDKAPLTRNGFKDASNDPKKIKEWWTQHPDANIGMPTGSINRFFVVDVDGKKPENFPHFDKDITVVTGRGQHYYVTLPEDINIKSCSGINELKIDVRGDGGYVVVPPSIHANGKSYKFVEEFILSECTSEILAFISQSNKNENAKKRKLIGDVSLLANDMDLLTSALDAIPNDLSYDDWIRVSAAYKAGVGGKIEYYPAFERWALRWFENTPEIVRRKWDSIKDAEAGAATIFYEAKKRGWKFPKLFSRKSPYDTAKTILDNCFSYEGKNILIYMHDFYLWKDGYFQAVHENQIKKIISEEMESAQQWDGNGKNKIPFNPKKNDIIEVFEAIKNKTLVSFGSQKKPPFWINNDRELPPLEILCVENGLLHIPSRSIIPHTPDFFTVNSLPYKYSMNAGQPKEWLRFLESVWPDDPESIECLQMYMGYLLTPDTSQHKILMLTGPARSGKGTISRIMTLLLGKNNVVSPLIGSFKDFGLEPLIDKTAALINDARPPKSGETVRNIIETLLTISGGDYVSVRRKNKGNWDGYLSVRFIMFSNEIPSTLKDPSQALAKRFIHIKMTKSFYEREDHSLFDKLQAEISGILNWALDGYDKLQERDKFAQPESGKDGLDYLKENSNPLSSFLSECCVIASGVSILTENLRAAYALHSGQEISAQDFGTNLFALCSTVKKVKKNQGYFYIGIGLNDNPVSEFFLVQDSVSLDEMMQ